MRILNWLRLTFAILKFLKIHLQATDADASPNINYELVSGGDGKFTVNPTNGVISLNSPADYETTKQYTLRISTTQATDKNFPGAFTEVIVNILVSLSSICLISFFHCTKLRIRILRFCFFCCIWVFYFVMLLSLNRTPTTPRLYSVLPATKKRFVRMMRWENLSWKLLPRIRIQRWVWRHQRYDVMLVLV